MQDGKIATTPPYISLNIDLAKRYNQRKTSSPIVALVCNLLYNNVTNFKLGLLSSAAQHMKLKFTEESFLPWR